MTKRSPAGDDGTAGRADDESWHALYRRPVPPSPVPPTPASAEAEPPAQARPRELPRDDESRFVPDVSDRNPDGPGWPPPQSGWGPEEENGVSQAFTDPGDLSSWLNALRRDSDPQPSAPVRVPAGRGLNRPPSADRAVAPSPRGPGRRRRLAVGLILSVLVLLGGGVAAAELVVPGGLGNAIGLRAGGTAGNGSEPDQKLAGAGTSGSDVQSGPVDGLTRASLDIVNDAIALRVSAVPLGETLYRIRAPRSSGVASQVTDRHGKVELAFRDNGEPGGDQVDIQLNSSVRWDLRLGGGLQQGQLDLSAGKLTSLELAGQATRIEVSLPRPAGTMPMRVTGGINQLVLHLSRLVPVRVRVGGGAGQVALRGKVYQSIASGALFTTPDWRDDVDRLDLNATVGMGALTVANT